MCVLYAAHKLFIQMQQCVLVATKFVRFEFICNLRIHRKRRRGEVVLPDLEAGGAESV